MIRDEINPRCGDYKTIKGNGYLRINTESAGMDQRLTSGDKYFRRLDPICKRHKSHRDVW